MTLKIQSPGSNSLLAELAAGLKGASECGAVFAFATSDGVDMFFAAASIVDLFERGQSVRLIVGMDAITNTRALKRLQHYQEKFEHHLEVQAVINSDVRFIFHPKLVWFTAEEQLRLLVGSGNLTPAGLGRDGDASNGCNWEAYSIQDYNGEERQIAQKSLYDWFERMAEEGLLHELSDQSVIDAGVENSRSSAGRRRRQSRQQHPAEGGASAVATPEAVEGDYAVIRELPKTRAGQADIGQRALKLFGYVEGERNTVTIQRVFLNESVGYAATRAIFKSASENYRIELDGLSGPEAQEIGGADERAVLVVVKLNQSAIRFCIVPVAAEAYNNLSIILGDISSCRPKMRERFFQTPDSFEKEWPTILEPMKAIEPAPFL